MTYPEDVMKAAREAAAIGYEATNLVGLPAAIRRGSYDEIIDVQSAARAIMAERERAARVAARWVRRAMHLSPDGYEIERTHGAMAEEAAAAIRKGEAS